LYGNVVGVLVVDVSRIVEAMIADPATTTTQWREHECDGKGCGSCRLHIKWLMVDPKDLASERPSEHAFDGNVKAILVESCDL
jgi:ferredoxin